MGWQDDVTGVPAAGSHRPLGATLDVSPRPRDGSATARLAPGAEDLFESLVTEHWRLIYRIAFRLTGNQAEADDLVQEAVVEAFHAFPQFQPGTRFDRWIARIMTHSFIDGTRRRRRRTVLSLDDGDTVEPADTTPGPEETADRHELHDRIQSVLLELPKEFRTAVVLVDLEGHSYEEAGRIMGTPIGTVRSRLHRARLVLRRRLEPVLRAS